jgi:hypothetical protein
LFYLYGFVLDNRKTKPNFMKTKIFPIALIVASVALSAIFLIQGCQKSVGPFDPTTTTYQYNLKGQVVNAQTNAGIPSATVRIMNKVYTTDINGFFSFRVSYATTFPFSINAEAAGYEVGSSVVSGPTQVRAIKLTLRNPEVIITEVGGTLVAATDESLSGSPFKLTVPAGAVAQSTAFTLTPMEEFFYLYENVEGIPGGNQGLIDLGTIAVSPASQVFAKPLSLYCPLPFATDEGTRYRVLKYDAAINSWTYSGQDLMVDATRNGGIVELTQGGIYSVAGIGTYTETKDSETIMFNYACDGGSPYVWQASINHPSGVPSEVSTVWLKNIVSHNSVLGGHVSFFNETSTSVVCESYQPGSSYPVPTDEVKIPLIPSCPSGTNPVLLDNGVTVNQRVISGVVSFTTVNNGTPETNTVPDLATVNLAIHAYSWKCLHDQGGGK